MVLRADDILPLSPLEVMYRKPPTIIMMTAAMPMIVLRMLTTAAMAWFTSRLFFGVVPHALSLFKVVHTTDCGVSAATTGTPRRAVPPMPKSNIAVTIKSLTRFMCSSYLTYYERYDTGSGGNQQQTDQCAY